MADLVERLSQYAPVVQRYGLVKPHSRASLAALLREAATELEALRKRCEAVEALAPKYPDDGNGDYDAYNAGWNACLKAIAAAQEPSHG